MQYCTSTRAVHEYALLIRDTYTRVRRPSCVPIAQWFSSPTVSECGSRDRRLDDCTRDVITILLMKTILTYRIETIGLNHFAAYWFFIIWPYNELCIILIERFEITSEVTRLMCILQFNSFRWGLVKKTNEKFALRKFEVLGWPRGIETRWRDK